ncbi:collagen alpha-1(XXVI) chain-like [Glandiceps talaboti]
MSKLFIFALLIIECCTQIEALGHKRTGNWCEHTVTKHISCRVRNGTEMHVEKVKPAWCNYKLSPPFSSRERNCGNSFRVVFRPIYRIEFQTIRTKKMSCCPGFSGQNCEIGKGEIYHNYEEEMVRKSDFNERTSFLLAMGEKLP